MAKGAIVAPVSDAEAFLAQYQMDSENLRYAKEIQWRIPSVLIALEGAVIAALSFWKQAGLAIPRTAIVLLIIALGIFSLLGLYLLNGTRKNLRGYRQRQFEIASYGFSNEFHRHAIDPRDYLRNKVTDVIFQTSFSAIVLASWIALSMMLIGLK